MKEMLKIKRLDFEATDRENVRLPECIIKKYDIRPGDVLRFKSNGDSEWFVVEIEHIHHFMSNSS